MMKPKPSRENAISPKTRLSLGVGLSLLIFAILALLSFFLSPAFVSPSPSPSPSSSPFLSSSSNSPIKLVESAFYQWSYRSDALYQGTTGAPLSIICEAHGNWDVKGDETLLFVDNFRCNQSDLSNNEHFAFAIGTLLKLSPRTLSEASPINALALALAREVDLGSTSLNQDVSQWAYPEERVQGRILRDVIAKKTGETYSWSKKFQGKLPGRPEFETILTSETKGESRSGMSPFSAVEVLHANESEVVSTGGQTLSSSKIAIEIKRVGESGFDRTRFKNVAKALPLPSAQSNPDVERQGLLSAWRNFLEDRSNPSAETNLRHDNLYVRLKLAFRNDPVFSKEFRNQLESFDPRSEEFKLLLGALAYAGSSEATDVLSESAKAKIEDPSWQIAMTPIMGLLSKPTEASWNYLEDVARGTGDPDLRKAVELAMAGEVGKGFKNDQTDHFVKSILARDENDIESILSMLDVIGNAALESEVPRVQKWAQRPEVQIRSAAAESLRLMNSPMSEELLLQLASDIAIEVRRTAAQAFQTRKITSDAIPAILTALARPENNDEILQSYWLETLYQGRGLDPLLLGKVRALRASLKISPALAERWAGLERDW